jgi:hypothetical protein
MFADAAPHIDSELRAITDPTLRGLLREDAVGHPPIYPGTSASSNLIDHAYHLQRFVDETGTNLANVQQVVEIGGGYGSMCRLLRQLSDCDYYIFDFPEFAALQRYYLGSLGISPAPKIASSPESIAIAKSAHPNLLIATWSLCEMPLSERSRVLAELPEFDLFLIAHNGRFYETENVEYFRRFRDERPGHQWTEVPIEHMRGCRYLFGKAFS